VQDSVQFNNENRRLYDRFTSRFPVKFKDSRSAFGSDVLLRNLSAGGAKISTRDRLYLNDSVNLEVELLDNRGPMTIRGEVVWVKERDANMWDVGLKFYKIALMDLWRIYETSEHNSSV